MVRRTEAPTSPSGQVAPAARFGAVQLAALFPRFFDAAPDAVVVVDVTGTIVLANRQIDVLFGYEPDDVVGKAIEVLIPERFRAEHVGNRDRFMADPQTRPMGAGLELWGRRSDGSEFPVEISLSPVHTDEGLLVMAAVRDMTERHAIDQERTHLANIVRSSDDAIIGKDMTGTIVSWNPGAERMYGYRSSEVVGQAASMLVPDGMRDDTAALVERVVQGERIEHYETRRRRKDGTVIDVSLNLAPIEDLRGETVGISTVARDITGSKRAEERFKMLLEGAPDALVLTDRDGAIVYANRQVTNLFGYEPDELLGEAVEVLIPERFRERHPDHRHAFFGAPAARPMGAGLDLWALRKDGTEFPVEISLSPLETEEGTVVMAAVRDMTEREEARRVLRHYAEQLERSNQDWEHFAYAVSHDLQEPLRMVRSYVQLLEKRYGDVIDDEGREFIHFAVDGAERMARLIRGLLAYSRVDTRGGEPTQVDLDAVLAEVLESLKLTIEEADAEVTHDPMPLVLADPDQLGQVLQNLVTNALKFRAERDPRVHVAATREDGVWRVWVRDNGIGIEPGQEDRVFAIFQRLHGRDEYPGDGMGLALVKKIVERYGGTLGYDSTPGEGSTFWFTLPAA